MTLETNKVISIAYTVKDSEGKLVDQAPVSHPYSFLSGQNQILPKLEEKIGEMLIGSKKSVTLTPEEGYGEDRVTWRTWVMEDICLFLSLLFPVRKLPSILIIPWQAKLWNLK